VRPESFRPPVTLCGRHLDLVPLEPTHAPALLLAAGDADVSRYLFDPPGRTIEETERYVALLLGRQSAGTDLAFAMRTLPERTVVGATRFLRIDRENDAVEIGGTWLDRTHWRTPLNTESKYLLLRHAFAVERVHRVTIQTDLRNERSLAAIARLGAIREGIHRGDRRLPTGRFRSSVFFSILADEWPSVEQRLERLLVRPWPIPPTPRGEPV